MSRSEPVDFLDLFRSVAKAASKDATRSSITHVRVGWNGEGTLDMCATDGARLHMVTVRGIPVDAPMPFAVGRHLYLVKPQPGELVTLAPGGLDAREYPDVSRVIPPASDDKAAGGAPIGINTRYLADASAFLASVGAALGVSAKTRHDAVLRTSGPLDPITLRVSSDRGVYVYDSLCVVMPMSK